MSLSNLFAITFAVHVYLYGFCVLSESVINRLVGVTVHIL